MSNENTMPNNLILETMKSGEGSCHFYRTIQKYSDSIVTGDRIKTF